MIKNTFVMVLLAMVVAGCSPDQLVVYNNSDRVAELERRADLKDQLDAAQSALIQANSQAIVALEGRLNEVFAELNAAIEAEAAARAAGDEEQADNLAKAVAIQTVVNLLTQFQLSRVDYQLDLLNGEFSRLNSRVNNLNYQLNNLESDVNSLLDDVSVLQLAMNATTVNLQALENRIDQEGVSVYACERSDGSLSEERFFKIGGDFYGAMNQVSKTVITHVTGGSPHVIVTPTLCKGLLGELKLPNNGGQCTPASYWNKVPETITTISSYTTADVEVVDKVQISLEKLEPGVSYVTTDGTASCSFTVAKLVKVQ